MMPCVRRSRDGATSPRPRGYYEPLVRFRRLPGLTVCFVRLELSRQPETREEILQKVPGVQSRESPRIASLSGCRTSARRT
jgi:hypothetical protein